MMRLVRRKMKIYTTYDNVYEMHILCNHNTPKKEIAQWFFTNGVRESHRVVVNNALKALRIYPGKTISGNDVEFFEIVIKYKSGTDARGMIEVPAKLIQSELEGYIKREGIKIRSSIVATTDYLVEASLIRDITLTIPEV